MSGEKDGDEDLMGQWIPNARRESEVNIIGRVA